MPVRLMADDGLEGFFHDDFKDSDLEGLKRFWQNEEEILDFIENYEVVKQYCPNHPLLKYCKIDYTDDEGGVCPVKFGFKARAFFENYKDKITGLKSQQVAVQVYKALVRITSKSAPMESLKRDIRNSYEELQILNPTDEALNFAKFGENGEITIRDTERLKQYMEVRASEIDKCRKAEEDFFSIETFYLQVYFTLLGKAIAQNIGLRERAGVTLEKKLTQKDGPK